MDPDSSFNYSYRRFLTSGVKGTGVKDLTKYLMEQVFFIVALPLCMYACMHVCAILDR